MIPTGFDLGTRKDIAISWPKSDRTFIADTHFPNPPLCNYFPYFEIFIVTCAQSGTVAIGLCSKSVPRFDALPGWNKQSYGYHADDGYLYCENGSGMEYGPTFGTGDIVGCGINNKGNVYFTKNGKLLGNAAKAPEKINFYPAVGLDKANITANFGQTPFVYDIFQENRVVMLVKDVEMKSEAALLQFGDDILLQVISELHYFKDICTISMTCKTLFKLARSNQIWKPLVQNKWPTVSPFIKIVSYYSFYRQRHRALLKATTKPPVLIENCVDWEFLCPVTLDKLKRTADTSVDFCTTCNKNVYLVHNQEQLIQKAKEQKCVAIDFNLKEMNKRRPPRQILRGKPVYIKR